MVNPSSKQLERSASNEEDATDKELASDVDGLRADVLAVAELEIILWGCQNSSRRKDPRGNALNGDPKTGNFLRGDGDGGKIPRGSGGDLSGESPAPSPNPQSFLPLAALSTEACRCKESAVQMGNGKSAGTGMGEKIPPGVWIGVEVGENIRGHGAGRHPPLRPMDSPFNN
ncbi:hypothetical protein PIB30_049388 [Stylosanthes scabra]|uniref:Uncharacterized protein n=1 Tax=Stylosanthes scabra TaxID=79078 RepID=A0ABU6WFE1_9FABA|nr:hypothetical protein [Stylosanthes scabra]